MTELRDATPEGRAPAPAAAQGDWPANALESVPACPVCGAAQRSLLYGDLRDRVFCCAPGVWRMYRCAGCTAAYLDPRPTPDSIGRAYQTYYTHKEAETDAAMGEGIYGFRRALRNGYLNARFSFRLEPASPLGLPLMYARMLTKARTDRRVRWLRFPPSGGRVLDVGCGNGEFLRRAASYGWDARGCDPDPNAVAQCAGAGLAVDCGTIHDLDAAPASFDAITLSHVIEHLHDPIADLRRCAELLKPGGRLVLMTPNLQSHSHAQYGADWRGLEPPRHLVLFNRRALARACAAAGLRVVGGARSSEVWLHDTFALADGRSPLLQPKPLTEAQYRALDRARYRSYLFPARAEELVVIATRTG